MKNTYFSWTFWLKQHCSFQLALAFTSMDLADPLNACRIASGIHFLREIGAPHVLQNCSNFDSVLKTYLRQCELCHETGRSTTIEHPQSHWWWQVKDEDADASRLAGEGVGDVGCTISYDIIVGIGMDPALWISIYNSHVRNSVLLAMGCAADCLHYRQYL